MSIDVTDIVLDPDLGGQTFDVIRETVGVSEGGLRTTVGTRIVGQAGNVQPATSGELERLPEAERLNGAITVYTPFPLTAGDGNRTADVVWWEGRHYTVATSNAWPQGRGWTMALCTLKPLRGETTRRPV